MFSRFGCAEDEYQYHAESWLPRLISVRARFGDFSGIVPGIYLRGIRDNSAPILCGEYEWKVESCEPVRSTYC